MSISGFLPEMSDKNKMPSAFLWTCIEFPGKITTGIEQLDLIVVIHVEKLPFVNKLPPTKIKSTLATTAFSISCNNSFVLCLSGSIKTAKSFLPFCLFKVMNL